MYSVQLHRTIDRLHFIPGEVKKQGITETTPPPPLPPQLTPISRSTHTPYPLFETHVQGSTSSRLQAVAAARRQRSLLLANISPPRSRPICPFTTLVLYVRTFVSRFPPQYTPFHRLSPPEIRTKKKSTEKSVRDQQQRPVKNFFRNCNGPGRII